MYSRPRTSSQARPGARARRSSASPQAGQRRTRPGAWLKTRPSAIGPVFPHPARRPGGPGHVDAEHVVESPADAVAVCPGLGHGVPPLGPNRSVLICRSARPCSASRRAALSTNPVGPQTKHCCAGRRWSREVEQAPGVQAPDGAGPPGQALPGCRRCRCSGRCRGPRGAAVRRRTAGWRGCGWSRSAASARCCRWRPGCGPWPSAARRPDPPPISRTGCGSSGCQTK